MVKIPLTDLLSLPPKDPIKYTTTIDNSINDQDIQPFTNGGMVCYGDSYKDILRGMVGAKTLYLDFETGSYDSSKTSLNPWITCWPIGIAISVDSVDFRNKLECNTPPVYYIPISSENEATVYDLLFEIFKHNNLKQWVNHNIKYDAHVLYNSSGISPNCKLVCTLTLAKLIDSDRFRFGLDELSKDWLGEDISQYESAMKPYKHRNKDYSQIPVDIIAPYACQDVITNRKLYKYICDNLPEECYNVRDTEIQLTSALVEMERNGLRVNKNHLQEVEQRNYVKLLLIEEQLTQLTDGKSFRPHTNADCFDILCNFYGLPVLKFTGGKKRGQNTNEGEYSSDDSDSEDQDTDDSEELNDISNEESDNNGEFKLSNDAANATKKSRSRSNSSSYTASFDKDTLKLYLAHPLVSTNPKLKKIVELIIEYRKINTFNNLFVKKYQELATDYTTNVITDYSGEIDETNCTDVSNCDTISSDCDNSNNTGCEEQKTISLLHPYYNQSVRTARLACKHPNAQQLDKNAKELILPYENELFVSYDFSQIEFRTIAHYIESKLLLDAYNENPDVDFHTKTAEMVREATGLIGVNRDGAKTLNFALGFGMGKEKTVRKLAADVALIDSLLKEFKEAGISNVENIFARTIMQRAEKVYNTYHRLLPEIKRVSRKATAVCERRGYVFNLYNRRRHLPLENAYRAFNTINQSSAADIVKDRMVHIYNLIKGSQIRLCASVHDEVLFSMPKKLAGDMRIIHTIANILEHPKCELLVPLRVAVGIGKHWKQASKCARLRKYDRFVSEDEFRSIINANHEQRSL